MKKLFFTLFSTLFNVLAFAGPRLSHDDYSHTHYSGGGGAGGALLILIVLGIMFLFSGGKK